MTIEKIFENFDEIISRAPQNVEKEYEKCIKKSKKIELSRGEPYGTYGYYPQEHLYKQIYEGHGKGKLLKNTAKKFDYKYYFDEDNRLILTEKYREEKLTAYIFFYEYLNYKEIYYFSGGERLYSVAKCIYDDKKKLKNYIQTEFILNKQADNFEEQIYNYFEDKVVITFRGSYKEDYYSSGKFTEKEYTFPLSFLEEQAQRPIKEISDEEMYTFLKTKFVKIIKGWETEDGYAISVWLNGFDTITLDYNTENENNQNPTCEERWNYAFWNQVNFEVLENEEERNYFRDWIDYIDFKRRSEYFTKRILEVKPFTNIIIKILNEIRAEGIIKEIFKKEVPIIIHDLEYYHTTTYLINKVNDKALTKNFFKWFREDI